MIVITAHSPPRRIPTYRALAHAYDATVGIPFFRGLRCAFEQLVNRHRIPFRSAADLGCGTGLFARYLHDRWRVPVLAVDRSAAMLKRAARRCDTSNVRLLRQDIRCL